MKHFLALPIAMLIVVAVAIFLGTMISYNNKSAVFKNQFKTQEQKIEASFDDLWKSISQVAQVDEKYRQDIKDLVIGYADARGDNGSLATSVTEAIPTIDASTANRLINLIIAKREEFKREQGILTSIAFNNNNMVDTFPGSIFLGYDDRLDAVIISSSKTKTVVDTKVDDDIGLYQ